MKMKKIIVTFITIFINMYCLGQSLPMPDVVNINFPWRYREAFGTTIFKFYVIPF
jgi:hypothetical protein